MRLRTKNELRWVDDKGKFCDGPDESGNAFFQVTYTTPKQRLQGITDNTIREWERGQSFEKTDWYAVKIARLRATIKDWRGVEDESGNPLSCNDANIEIVYLYNPDLIDNVIQAVDAYSMLLHEMDAAAEKN